MAEETDFQIGHFRIFRGSVTLTLTSNNLESHMVVNDKTTSTNIINRFVAALRFIVNVWTDGRTDVGTDGRTDERMDRHGQTKLASDLDKRAEKIPTGDGDCVPFRKRRSF